MGFSQIAQLKAKLAETLVKIKDTQLSAGIKAADVQLKALNAEKASLDAAISKELTGNKPQFIGDTVEFKKPDEKDTMQKALDKDVKPSSPKYVE